MAKSRQKKKQGESRTSPAASAPKSKAALRVARENGRLVGLTLAAAVLSLVIAFPPLSPLLLTAPVVRPLLRRARGADPPAVTAALWRWALAVFLAILVSGAFVRDRVLSAFPFAAQSARAMEHAIAGSGAAPVGFLEILAGTIAFVILTAATVGIAGCVLMSVAVGTAAGGAIAVFTHGNNIVLISLVACPPWQWALFVAAVLVFAPAVFVGGARWYGIKNPLESDNTATRRAIIAVGLVLIAVLLRGMLAGPYLALLRHWTLQ